MKITLNLKALEAQPRKFVSFLHEADQGPTEFSGKARQGTKKGSNANYKDPILLSKI